MPLTYLPLAADGLAFITTDDGQAFSTSFCAVEGNFADGNVDERGLVGAELNFTGLDLLDRGGDVDGDGPGLGVGHQAAGPSTLPRRPTDFIMSGVAIRASKSVQDSFWIFSTSSSPPTMSAPAASRVARLIARGDDGDPLGLAEAVGKNNRAADHLVGVLGVDAETHGQVDGLIELGELDFLQ